jgi:hypothetical protein
MVVKTIIFVILGLIVGACIVACWYCVVFICDGKIHSEEELKDLNLIRSLGAFPQETKGQAFVDKWLDKLAGVDKNKTAAQAEQLIVLNIQNYAGEAKNILVTGSASEEELARVQKVLADGLAGATVSVGKDAESNVESYKKAVASDAVVFVEKQGSSKYIELLKDKQFAESLGKEIAGCVLL